MPDTPVSRPSISTLPCCPSVTKLESPPEPCQIPLLSELAILHDDSIFEIEAVRTVGLDRGGTAGMNRLTHAALM